MKQWQSVVGVFVCATLVASLGLTSRCFAAADAEAGKVIYEKKCAKCHGTTGDGKGKSAKTLEHTDHLAMNDKSKLSDDATLAKIIKKGGPAAKQSDEMEAFPKLSDDDVANVIAYIKTLAK